MNWYDDLCEYYNVSAEEAISLSERSLGRKPSFPGSATCEPVTGKTWVDHGDDGPGESDLEEAEAEREITQNLIKEKFNLVYDAGGIRFHQLKNLNNTLQFSSNNQFFK